MLTNFDVVSPRDSLESVVELTLRGSQRDFPVLDRGALLGVLTQEQLLSGLARFGPASFVSGLSVSQPRALHPADRLDRVLAESDAESGEAGRTSPVLEHGRLVGLVTGENVRELLRIRTILQAREASPGAASRLAALDPPVSPARARRRAPPDGVTAPPRQEPSHEPPRTTGRRSQRSARGPR